MAIQDILVLVLVATRVQEIQDILVTLAWDCQVTPDIVLHQATLVIPVIALQVTLVSLVILEAESQVIVDKILVPQDTLVFQDIVGTLGLENQVIVAADIVAIAGGLGTLVLQVHQAILVTLEVARQVTVVTLELEILVTLACLDILVQVFQVTLLTLATLAVVYQDTLVTREVVLAATLLILVILPTQATLESQAIAAILEVEFLVTLRTRDIQDREFLAILHTLDTLLIQASVAILAAE